MTWHVDPSFCRHVWSLQAVPSILCGLAWVPKSWCRIRSWQAVEAMPPFRHLTIFGFLQLLRLFPRWPFWRPTEVVCHLVSCARYVGGFEAFQIGFFAGDSHFAAYEIQGRVAVRKPLRQSQGHHWVWLYRQFYAARAQFLAPYPYGD